MAQNIKLVQDADEAKQNLENATDEEARMALTNLQEAIESYFSAKDTVKSVGKEGKEAVEAAWVALKQNIEESVTKNTKEEVIGKLERISFAYQEYEDAVSFSKEGKKAAKEEVSSALETLKRTISDSKQLTLGF